jgi:hypothetical protein
MADDPVKQVWDDVESYSPEADLPAFGADIMQQVSQGQMPALSEQAIYAALQKEAMAQKARQQGILEQMAKREQEYAASNKGMSPTEKAALMFQAAGALAAPTRSGAFGESLGALGTAISGPLLKQAEADRARQEKLMQLQMAREKMALEMPTGEVGASELLKLYQLQQAKVKEPSDYERLRARLSPEEQARADRIKAGLEEGEGKSQKLPFSAVEKFSEQGGVLKTYDELGNTFKNDFADKTFSAVGDIQNWIGSRGKMGYGDQADWWSDYYRQRNVARNALFGSALTKTEAAAFEKTDINPGMSPDQIRKNLERQRELARTAAYKIGASMASQGFSQKTIEEAIGYRFDDLKEKRKLTEEGKKEGDKAPEGKTIARTGTITEGPNKGKKVIEYSDGSREIK